MSPLSALSRSDVSEIEVIFTDIDGTLTDSDGRIPTAVFDALDRVRRVGLAVIPVTGRPAGWCDMIARTWPVDGVIGENGGLYFRRIENAGSDEMLRVFAQSAEVRSANRAKLDSFAEAVLAAHPGAALASDQRYRELDLAIDFCEDVPALPDEEVLAIKADLEARGCQVKLSNIHVNAWFGSHDKAAMCIRYGADRWGWNLRGDDGQRALFFGDSPNDAPLFGLFPHSIGVANVRRMADRIATLPSYVTEGEGAAGFVEGIDRLLELLGS